jgi:cobalamin biosynthesis protein CbiD
MESKISINGGPFVPLSSLTKEEKDAAWEIIAERISRTITEYVDQHPEEYTIVRDALINAGGKLIYEERC